MKANIAQLFQLSEEKVSQLFIGKTLILKRDLDYLQAEKFYRYFLDAGAVCQVEPPLDRASVLKIDDIEEDSIEEEKVEEDNSAIGKQQAKASVVVGSGASNIVEGAAENMSESEATEKSDEELKRLKEEEEEQSRLEEIWAAEAEKARIEEQVIANTKAEEAEKARIEKAKAEKEKADEEARIEKELAEKVEAKRKREKEASSLVVVAGTDEISRDRIDVVGAAENSSDESSAMHAKPAKRVRSKSQEVLCCPRCAHQQVFATTCEFCKMDLRLHIKRLERKEMLRAARSPMKKSG